MKNDSEKNIKFYAAGWTLLVHVAVLLIMIFFVIKTPIPPYPVAGGGGGLEVNLGNSDDGMGEVQPEKLTVENNVENNVEPNNTAEDENVITQNIEDAPSIKANKNKNKNKVNNNITTVKSEENALKINDPIVNSQALYNKKKNGGNEGETGKPGDQGKPNGDPNSKNHHGDGGSGGGTGGGNGSGNGPGNGTGVGSGKDKGVTFYLKGRNRKSLPIPLYVIKEEGIVVVEIIVNKEGKVVRTKAGAKGTNTTNSTLWKRAEEAAKKAEFDSDPKAADEQKGTITYHFILN